MWIVDFNPFGPTTDPLLFDDWSELASLDSERNDVDFRIIETQAAVRSAPESIQRVPADLAGLASAEDLDEFISGVKKMQFAQRDQELPEQ